MQELARGCLVPAFFLAGDILGSLFFGCARWCLVASGAIERFHLCDEIDDLILAGESIVVQVTSINRLEVISTDLGLSVHDYTSGI